MMDVAVEIRKGIGKALREVTCGGVQQYLKVSLEIAT